MSQINLIYGGDIMKKGYKHTDLSNVECANKKCREVNGQSGPGPNRLIKQRLVDKFGTDRPLYCYPCSIHQKTGLTLAEQKRARGKRIKNKEELKRAEELKTMTAGA
jgi:hypothetical protein